MKSFLEEFKTFALRGNVIDLAIGVVIGTAFNNVVNSLVTNILTPPLGLLLGHINFADLSINIDNTVHIQYGLFIQSIVSFIITAFALFLLVRGINRLEHLARLKREEEAAAPTVKSAELVVLEDIRDILKK